ncbi:hypothetical protein C8J57DRAFT_1357916 [Mycena rebaudengoi]|nr:hypothetical protein C8J57DRAFT_1357916 [Mycena rebaudengoi]
MRITGRLCLCLLRLRLHLQEPRPPAPPVSHLFIRVRHAPALHASRSIRPRLKTLEGARSPDAVRLTMLSDFTAAASSTHRRRLRARRAHRPQVRTPLKTCTRYRAVRMQLRLMICVVANNVVW